MQWLTTDELCRAMNEAGVPLTRGTAATWASNTPGISRLSPIVGCFTPACQSY